MQKEAKTTHAKRIRGGLVAAGLLGLAPAAFPECIADGCYDVFIEELYPEAAGGAWVQTSGNEALAACTVDSGIFLRLNASAGFKEIYATLLAAQLSEKRVSLRIVQGSNPCTIYYVRVNTNTW